MYSNLGGILLLYFTIKFEGTATAIGDPPNVLIVSDERIKRTGAINFGSFALHMTPGVLLACLTSYLLIKYLSKSKLQREPNMGKKKEIEIWVKTARKLREDNEEERVVKR